MRDFTTATPPAWTPALEEAVVTAAADAGFHLSGIASAQPYDAGSATDQEGARFVSWVEQGRAGEMEYLKRRDATGSLLRSSLRVAIPWARSVIVCAVNYASSRPSSLEPAPTVSGWIGRYAWSGRRTSETEDLVPTDYHEELLRMLRIVEARLLENTSCQTRCYVDTGPIVERDFAAKAGIGWIGKNTCVLNQDIGSWLLLGVIVTSLTVTSHAVLDIAPDRCGSCTRCIDACPTGALVAPREMDASRCIAYLTIEKKGPIPSEFREAMGRQVFGCDICQDVCPWNTRATKSSYREASHPGKQRQPSAANAAMEVREELVNPRLNWLAALDSAAFKLWFKGSPLERTGKKRLHRNVAIAMGNSAHAGFLPQLHLWAGGEDPVLAEAARWAIERIQSASIES